MRKVTLSLVLLALAFAGSTANAGQEPDSSILRAIRTYRAQTWHYQAVMGVAKTPFRVTASYPVLRTRWHAHALAAEKRFRSGPPHEQAWLCIHHYEGSWTDHGAPYY